MRTSSIWAYGTIVIGLSVLSLASAVFSTVFLLAAIGSILEHDVIESAIFMGCGLGGFFVFLSLVTLIMRRVDEHGW